MFHTFKNIFDRNVEFENLVTYLMDHKFYFHLAHFPLVNLHIHMWSENTVPNFKLLKSVVFNLEKFVFEIFILYYIFTKFGFMKNIKKNTDIYLYLLINFICCNL